jgi:hypothetical protein
MLAEARSDTFLEDATHEGIIRDDRTVTRIVELLDGTCPR